MFNVSKFYKHIFINLLLVTVSIVSISFAVFIGNQFRVSKNSLNQSYINQSKEITTSLDYKLDSGINLINELSINRLSFDFVSLDKFDSIAVLDLYKYMSSSASLIHNLEITIGVYNDDLDMIVSNDSSSNSHSFLQKFNLTESEDTMKLFDSNFSELDFLSATELIYGSDGKPQYISHAVRKTHLPNEPLFIVIYSVDSLTNQIINNSSLTDFSIDYIKDNTKALNNNTLIKESSSLPLMYTLVFQSPRTTISLLSLIKIILIFTLIILFSLLLIYKCSNNVYNPVESLVSYTRDNDYSEPIIDEFEYIKQHVNNLKQTINIYQISNKDILLKEILYGIKKENIDNLLFQNQISLFKSKCFLVIIYSSENNTKDKHNTLKSYTELSLLESYNNLVEYTNYKFINMSKNTNILFLNSIPRDKVKTIFNETYTLSSKYNFIITDYLKSNEVSSKLYDINELIKNDKIANTNTVILEEDIVIQAQTPYLFSESDKEVLIYNVTSGNRSELLALLNKILDENLFNRTLPPKVHNEFLSAICSTLINISSNIKTNDELFNILINIDDKNNLKTTINDLFIEYFDYVNDQSISSNNKYNFLEYIHNNYDRDISLTDMADEFNLAVNYVGVLFKETTGYNFKDYLNTYRINVSKQILLETPSIKIKDLATAVGFLNTNTFIRTFKKYENMPPGQYKKYVLDTNVNI